MSRAETFSLDKCHSIRARARRFGGNIFAIRPDDHCERRACPLGRRRQNMRKQRLVRHLMQHFRQ
jgi:hypothetical protein